MTTEGYAASRRLRAASEPSRCQNPDCAKALPVEAKSTRKYCDVRCRNAVNAPNRAKRSQAGRKEYFRTYQRERRKNAQ